MAGQQQRHGALLTRIARGQTHRSMARVLASCWAVPASPLSTSLACPLVMARRGVTATAKAPSPPSPPPPLSILSWAVDGSGHTHHRCQRRLSIAERIPLVCETIRAAAPDVVALQDSTAALAAALAAPLPHSSHGASDAAAPALHIHCMELARELHAAPSAPLLPCRYRLLGRARNGRCGEVQVFVKDGSAWEARLLPSMGAGLTVELHTRALPTAAPTPASSSSADVDASAVGPDTSGGAHDTASTGTPLARSAAETRCHRCVLTSLDLSYRGKSLGTNGEGLLAGAAVSADGSPFTLQAPPRSSSTSPAAAKRPSRPPGQLDAHRALALDWVRHHVRPDIVVGNLFAGAREHVPGFEDAWVRAGSPAGQERTTNTCARHRVDQVTNYFYFLPDLRTSPAAADAPAVAAADAPAGTPIPLTAVRDPSAGASWVCAAPEGRDDRAAVKSAVHGVVGAVAGGVSAHGADGMPEVAGRFQRCLLRGWVRRGLPSRSHHQSAHPLLRQYRSCRVVVLRPMVEVDLSASEQAWHTRYITAQYSARGRTVSATGGSRSTAAATDDATAAGEARSTDTEDPAEARDTASVAASASSAPWQARVRSRVRCSISDQYPLLTLLA
ncbi:hypothetical protein NESM_000322200 [Novymonas esmeraldas]|uniref:Endonuclease/exonuclease/phosphatase domain-containing protein n=1 Tax=Novymonas esmeraldas TaxID=1808958 RepID=A0AAW0EIY0_9TRYP